MIEESTGSPWHRGEVALQRSVGADTALAEVGARVVRDHLVAQHREFFALLPMIVMATVDAAGDAWPTLRSGPAGFVQASDERHLHVASEHDADDPATAGLVPDAAIALLGIDPRTRRRNRANGTVVARDATGIDVRVRQSFGNCPKYIRLRDVDVDTPSTARGPAQWMDVLDDDARALVTGADTFFVASYVDLPDERQVDVSHRGGLPGFVRIDDDGRRLTVPDFAGNHYFNTLGNLVVNPKAGLVFVDFALGDLLQMTGDAVVVLDAAARSAYAGAERVWHFVPRRIVRRTGALPLHWLSREGGRSPFLDGTGSWT